MLKMKGTVLMVVILTIMMFSLVLGTEAAEYDFDGQTITFGTDAASFAPYREGSEGADTELVEHVADIEEEYNVNIEFLDMEGDEVRDEFYSSVLAGDPIVDVLYMWRRKFVEQFLGEGITYPLNEVLDEDYFESLPPNHRGDKVKDYLESYDGNYYTFSAGGGIHESIKLMGNAYILYWNKSIFEREGLPNLYELYENGEWTWEKFLEIAEEATDDTDGDGEVDQWGYNYFSFYSALPVYEGWFHSNSVQAGRKEDGRMVFNLTDEPALKTFEFRNKAFQYKAPVFEQDFVDGNVAMEFGPIALTGILEDQEMEDEWGIMLWPKGPRREENIVSSQLHVFALPLTTDQPEELVELTNALFKITMDHIDMTDEEYVDYIVRENSMFLQDRESVAIFEEMLNSWAFYPESNLLVPEGEMMPRQDAIFSGEQSPAASMEELAPVAQSVFDEIFNQ